ncbi:hypothetical protein DITRI_Ditri17bG0062700 [Diplodiscus trichospermus]
MKNFREAILDGGFHALPISAPLFTWSSSCNQNLILEKLDGGLVTEALLNCFPHSTEFHLRVSSSDHMALLFKISEREKASRAKSRNFKFENSWISRPDYEEVIKKSLIPSDSHSTASLAASVRSCGKALLRWNREVAGHLQTKIAQKEKDLEQLLNNMHVNQNFDAIQTCKRDLSLLHHNEEVLWRQRAKCNWIKEGDRNTRISEEDCLCLGKDFTTEEVRAVMLQINLNKAPGQME